VKMLRDGKNKQNVQKASDSKATSVEWLEEHMIALPVLILLL